MVDRMELIDFLREFDLSANDDLTIITHEIDGQLVGEYKIIYK